jgi:hypothetical protein
VDQPLVVEGDDGRFVFCPHCDLSFKGELPTMTFSEAERLAHRLWTAEPSTGLTDPTRKKAWQALIEAIRKLAGPICHIRGEDGYLLCGQPHDPGVAHGGQAVATCIPCLQVVGRCAHCGFYHEIECPTERRRVEIVRAAAELEPEPCRRDFTVRECTSLLGAMIGGLQQFADVETIRRAVHWYTKSDAPWQMFRLMEREGEKVAAEALAKLNRDDDKDDNN